MSELVTYNVSTCVCGIFMLPCYNKHQRFATLLWPTKRRGRYTGVYFDSTYLAQIRRFAKQLEVIALIKTIRNIAWMIVANLGPYLFPMLNFRQLRRILSWKLEIVGLCELVAKDTSTAETTKNTAAKCCYAWWKVAADAWSFGCVAPM